MSDCPLPLLLRPDGKPVTLQSYLARMASEPVERVVMHVMRAAQQDDLPLYAWTLALPQHRLLVLLRALYPELPVLQGLPVAAYRRLVARVPPCRQALVDHLLAHADPDGDHLRQEALARALAMAGMGEAELWQDAGMPSPQALQQLLKTHFPDLPASGMVWGSIGQGGSVGLQG